MSYTLRDAVVTFRCTPEMAADLARLGGNTQNTRSNVVYLLIAAALNGCADDTIRILKARK